MDVTITGVDIEGFGCFKQPVSFEFDKNINVISGPNCSGKTTLLNAILYATGKQNHAIYSRGHVKVRMDLTSAPGTILGTHAPCRLDVVRTLNKTEIFVNEKLLSVGNHALYTLLSDIQMFNYHPCFFEVPSVDKDTWLDRLNEALKTLAGKDSLSVSLGDRDEILLVKQTQEGQIVYQLGQASHGELAAISLIGTLLVEIRTGIVLIDAPDLHMCFDWQARLLYMLDRVVPDSQLIMVSSSDPLWDQVYSFQRILL